MEEDLLTKDKKKKEEEAKDAVVKT